MVMDFLETTNKNVQFWRNFGAQIVKICKMHWKLRIKQTPVLFCKYFRNECLDLHEFYVVVKYYLVSWNFKFREDPFINVPARVINVHTHVLLHVRAFKTRARAFVHGSSWKIVFDHHIKFNEDPSFRCRDICKTIPTFV